MPGADVHPGSSDAGGAEAPRRTKLIFLARNTLSALGLFLVGLGLMLLFTFALFALVSPSVNPYFGIVGYVVLPGVFIVGLIIVPLGMLLKQGRLRREARTRGAPVHYPAIDLNDARTRAWVGLFFGFSFFVVLPVLGVSSYYGYEYTESVQFCGQVCHTVMKPEATAHAQSAHARVTCAGCHIGPGASWFVKSKITGVGQVIAVLRNSYPRPIPPAIVDLRPARETCEQCHWPARFFGAQYKQFAHYSTDEENTRRVVDMLLKVGGEEVGRRPGTGGIHNSMLFAGRIDYVASDRGLQHVPWVRHWRLDGTVVTYRSDGQPGSAPPPAGVERKLDCMDCHNRGAHHFAAPQTGLDAALENQQIDRTLPYVKREAVAALVVPYADTAAASAGIAQRLIGFYREAYPQVWAERSAAVEAAVGGVRAVYRRDFFPTMRVDWQTYPENVGHLTSPGCFRCHDGRHVADDGQAITSRCDVCHVVLNPLPEMPQAFVEGEFHHAMSLVPHENLRCDECHTGGVLLSCAECHQRLATQPWPEALFRPNVPARPTSQP